jgi:type I restriction enzyme S subunit
MKNYVDTPVSISFKEVAKDNFTLSSSQYKSLIIKNQHTIPVSNFMSHKLTNADLGNEVGAINYIRQSTHYFMRTKALQDYCFIPEITSETVLPLNPKVFRDMKLKKGDIIISKDSNIGEIAILDKDYPNIMLSGALYKLPVAKMKYYLLAFIKHPVFRQQLDYLVPKGATIRHAKTLFLDCKIPLPTYNSENIIRYIENLMQAVINKESLIKERHHAILKEIECELRDNQKNIAFNYSFPRFKEVTEVGRLDASLYTNYFKKNIFEIINYKYGYKNIEELGFNLSRGQNLQISNIGKSIYSENYYDNFYTLILPKFISQYGTVNTIEFLGNSNDLKTLKKGDLIFGAEGFEKGRSIVILEDKERAITNIHGITIKQDEHDATKGIFVKCFLDYLRNKKMIDLIAVGGNGGSLAQKYWRYIPFPLFPKYTEEEIAKLYHNPNAKYELHKCNLSSFLEYDDKFNSIAGIYELDKSSKLLKQKINAAIDKICDDEDVSIVF